ncbi:MAG: SpoIIE family protein phosphatase [Spirochaetes bacterium]|nr:SpoIIE family protein phosphatase [Spirochaetota bacterium]
MNIVSVPVAMMAAVCLYVGVYYLWMYTRRRKEKENLAFAMLSISIALYDLFCVGLYNVSSPAEGMFWQRFQFASLDLFSIFLLWFAYHITERKVKVPYLVFGSLAALLFVLVLTVQGELTFSLAHPLPRRVQLWGIVDVTYNEVEPGLLCTLQYVIMMAGFIWILARLIIHYRKGHRIVRPVMISFIIFFFAAANDVLVGAGVYPFIYVLEYVYLIIVLSMAYLLMNKFVDLHEEVEDLNVNLEQRVQDRTEELQSAMEELEAMNQQLVETKDALWGEMQLAKKIQTVLLPLKPNIAGYEIATHMEPAGEVGGDYYDIINVQGKDWLVVGDVSGHGVSAGLIMMMVQTSIHVALDQNPGIPPSELLTLINRTISDNINRFGEMKYMTITVMAEHENGKFFFSGLHQDLMVYRAKTQSVEMIETRGMWIGLINSVDGMMEDDLLTINTGDVLLVYTDGITEALCKLPGSDECDDSSEMFGDQKLAGILMENGRRSPEEIKKNILDALNGYCCNDDVTMVIAKKIT